MCSSDLRNTRLECPHYRAQTMLSLAELLGARDPARAGTLVAEARSIAARHGFEGLRAEADRLLA